MSRTIINEADVVALQNPVISQSEDLEISPGSRLHKEPKIPLEIKPAVSADDYSGRLLKYIPAEVIAVYLTLETLLASTAEPKPGMHWLTFGFGIVVTPIYLWRLLHIRKKTQILISTIAFVVWAFALGGPFTYFASYNPIYGALLLTMYTFVVPLIQPEDYK